MGVQRADLDDLAHDVFVVVHRRLASFDNTGRMTTWLFGICLRLVANYRRRRRRTPTEAVLRARMRDDAAIPAGADELLARGQDRAGAERVLAELSVEKRAAFIMFEIEGLSCHEIAALMGVRIGTVYSRLYGAREQIEAIVSRAYPATERGPARKRGSGRWSRHQNVQAPAGQIAFVKG